MINFAKKYGKRSFCKKSTLLTLLHPFLLTIFIGPESDYWLPLLTLLLLLMLMLRNVLTTVWCRFGSWSLFKNHIFSDLEHKVWSRFWSWSSGEILKLKFGQYFAADFWLRLRSWILVNILKLDLVLILTLDLVKMLMFDWDFKVNA